MLRVEAKYVRLVLAVGVAALIAGVAVGQSPNQKTLVVRDAENPDRQTPFHDSWYSSVPDGEHSVEHCTDTVAEGQRLVLENASARVLVPAGQAPHVTIELGATIIVPVAFLPLTSTGLYNDTQDGFTGSMPLRVRYTAGQRACVYMWRNLTAGTAVINWVLTGYTIDVP